MSTHNCRLYSILVYPCTFKHTLSHSFTHTRCVSLHPCSQSVCRHSVRSCWSTSLSLCMRMTSIVPSGRGWLALQMETIENNNQNHDIIITLRHTYTYRLLLRTFLMSVFYKKPIFPCRFYFNLKTNYILSNVILRIYLTFH